MKVGLILLLLGGALAGLPGMAGADLSVGLACATGTSPYKDYDRQWSAVPLVDFENDRFYIRDLSAGLKFFSSGELKLAVFLGYDPTSFDGSESSDPGLKRLNKRRDGLMVGGDVQWTSPVGHFSLSLGGDVSGRSQGFRGRLAYIRPLDFGTLEFVPQLGT
jgi:outer membrane protein